MNVNNPIKSMEVNKKDYSMGAVLAVLVGIGSGIGGGAFSLLGIAQGAIFAANSKAFKVSMPRAAFSYGLARTAFAATAYASSLFYYLNLELDRSSLEKEKPTGIVSVLSTGSKVALPAIVLGSFAGRAATSRLTGVKLLGSEIAKLEGLHLIETASLGAIIFQIKEKIR